MDCHGLKSHNDKFMLFTRHSEAMSKIPRKLSFALNDDIAEESKKNRFFSNAQTGGRYSSDEATPPLPPLILGEGEIIGEFMSHTSS